MELERISACTYPYRDRPWQEAFQRLAEAGFTQVDLLGRAPHLAPQADPGELALIAATARALGLRIANLGSYAGRAFASPDPFAQEAELAALERTVDAAVLLGARSLRVSPGDDDPAYIERLVPWFQRGAAYAQAQGILLGFETHGGGISGDPARAVELCQRVGSPAFGILVDPCNILHTGRDVRAAIEVMRAHIVHVHLKDGLLAADGFHLTMLGEGQVEISWMLGRLAAWGYAGEIALEYELAAPSPEQALPRWLEVARAW